MRVSASAWLFTQHCSLLPEHGTEQEMGYVEDELGVFIKHTRKTGGATANHKAIKWLQNLLSEDTKDQTPKSGEQLTAPAPPMSESRIESSGNPASPRLMQSKLWIPWRQTRRNTSGIVPI